MRHRAAVYILFLLELVQSILLAMELIQAAAAVQPSVDLFWFSVYIVSPITCAATQWCYAKRIIELSRRHIWSGFIATFSVGQLISGIIASVSLALEQSGRSDPPFVLMVYMWLGFSIVADLIIVVSMSIMLSKARWTSYSQSAGIATRLTTIIVETGSLMACGPIIVFGLQFSPQPVAGFPLLLLSKLSACTLLACLNNRALNGQDVYSSLDLGDDPSKMELHSSARGGAGYENPGAGLAYVQYGA